MTFDPQYGDRCHWRLHSDIEPVTVIKRTPKRVTVVLDRAVLTKPPKMEPGGFAGVVVSKPEWWISHDPHGMTYQFTLRKNGRWMLIGCSSDSKGMVLGPGWQKFYDYGY